VIEEAALYAELRNGRLQAGLDVWYNYPPDEAARGDAMPANYPFHELDNVVMSPHRAGGSDQTERLRMEGLAELLNAAGQGQPIPNRVDLTAGY
jgi:phosphoglycerate dehydrogenase-like enzyme